MRSRASRNTKRIKDPFPRVEDGLENMSLSNCKTSIYDIEALPLISDSAVHVPVAPSSNIGFLSIPRELRDLVYGYILLPGDGSVALNSVTPLLLTSQQVYAEASELLWSIATFQITIDKNLKATQRLSKFIFLQERPKPRSAERLLERNRCLGRHQIRSIQLFCYNLWAVELRGVVRLLQYLPALEKLRISLRESLSSVTDLQIYDVCRSLRHKVPSLKRIKLEIRLNDLEGGSPTNTKVVDISWMLDNDPEKRSKHSTKGLFLFE